MEGFPKQKQGLAVQIIVGLIKLSFEDRSREGGGGGKEIGDGE